MNNERRKRLDEIKERICSIMNELTGDIEDQLQSICDEEQAYYDNMPESIQNGERGERAQQVIDSLDEAISDLESLDVEPITSNIETAAE